MCVSVPACAGVCCCVNVWRDSSVQGVCERCERESSK